MDHFTVPQPTSKAQKIQKAQDVGERQDIISNLPDCILDHILSFLPTKDVLRTSVLSKRWEYMWTSISNIELDDGLGPIGNSQNLDFRHFLNLVQRVVLFHDNSDIKRFRLMLNVPVNVFHFCLWVVVLVVRNVEQLDLSLPPKQHFIFPHCLFVSQSLTTLNLEMVGILKVPTVICFSSLKILNLSLVTFPNDQSTRRLFAGCPVLQELSLTNCSWEVRKSTTIFSPTLKRLSVYYDPFCYVDLLDCVVNIDASNLVSLYFSSYLTIEFSLCNLSSLFTADIDVANLGYTEQAAHRAIKLLSGVQHARNLTLSDYTLYATSQAENIQALPKFYNLIHLEVTDRDSGYSIGKMLIDFLQRTPNLESIDISEGLKLGPYLMSNAFLQCFKSCLKKFSISDFKGNAAEMHLLKYLLENATVLEKIIIFWSEDLSADLEKLEKEIRNQLQLLPRGSSSCTLNFHQLDIS